MKFIFDHSLPPTLAEILAILEGPAGHTIEHLRRFYPQDTEDAVWLPRLAQDAPDVVIVTADPRIARTFLASLTAAGSTAVWGSAPGRAPAPRAR